MRRFPFLMSQGSPTLGIVAAWSFCNASLILIIEASLPKTGG